MGQARPADQRASTVARTAGIVWKRCSRPSSDVGTATRAIASAHDSTGPASTSTGKEPLQVCRVPSRLVRSHGGCRSRPDDRGCSSAFPHQPAPCGRHHCGSSEPRLCLDSHPLGHLPRHPCRHTFATNTNRASGVLAMGRQTADSVASGSDHAPRAGLEHRE